MTPASFCQAQGWKVGDVLTKDRSELGWPPPEIVITAIAKHHVIGIRKDSPDDITGETLFDISKIWRKVGSMDPFTDELVWP